MKSWQTSHNGFKLHVDRVQNKIKMQLSIFVALLPSIYLLRNKIIIYSLGQLY